MSVSDITNKVSFAGNDSTTAFDFGFKVFGTDQLEVILVSAAGVESVKTLTTEYTVELDSDGEGGTVTMLLAPATGETLLIRSNIPFTQPDTVQAGPLPNQTIEQIADRVTRLTNQLQEQIGRAALLKKSSTASQPELPDPESGKVLTWSGAGDIINTTPSTTDATVLDEDDFSSDSDTAVPTQQSTKAYIASESLSIANDAIYVSAVTKTGPSTLNINEPYVNLATAAGGNTFFQYTLPTAVGNAGRRLVLTKSVLGSANNSGCIITGAGSETIGGATSVQIWRTGGYMELVSNGSNWLIVRSKLGTNANLSETGAFPPFGTNGSSWGSTQIHWQVDVDDVWATFTWYRLLTGAPPTATLRLDLPANCVIDQTLLGGGGAALNDFFHGLPNVSGFLEDANTSNRYHISNCWINASVGSGVNDIIDPTYLNSSALQAQINATTPFTWATGDSFLISARVPLSSYY